MKEIYADFNDIAEDGTLPLTCNGSVASIASLEGTLKSGEEVVLSDGEVWTTGQVFCLQRRFVGRTVRLAVHNLRNRPHHLKGSEGSGQISALVCGSGLLSSRRLMPSRTSRSSSPGLQRDPKHPQPELGSGSEPVNENETLALSIY